ncbi:class I SAM-dependent methyltransferase [Patescibacteria group bacterium]|nr:class I SAM-dependent methyltransferase [Patescibacteria group bacterium]
MDNNKEYFRKANDVEKWFWQGQWQADKENGRMARYVDFVNEKQYRSILSRYFGSLEDVANKNFLSVGVGMGSNFDNLLQKLDANVVGLDIASLPLKNIKKNGKVFLSQASLYDLPYGNEVFDGVVSINVFNTSIGRDFILLQRALEEKSRVLKKDGIYIQSNYGDQPITKDFDMHMECLRAAGFANIEILENKRIKEMADLTNPLAYIARKKCGYTE